MAGYLLVIESDGRENEKPVNTIKDQWQVQFARFITYPSFPSTCPSLVPLPKNTRYRAPRGNWIATSFPVASLQIINDFSCSETIIAVCLSGKILGEHYISKLHFSSPQIQCITEFPARGSRAVFVSCKDSADEIQKFALRFSTLHEAESFMNALKKNLKGEVEIEPLNIDFGSEVSSQSEFIPSNGLPSRACQELSDTTPGDSYTPQMAPSLSNESEHQSCDQDAMLNHNSEGIFPALPPSFTFLLTNCCSTAEQVSRRQRVPHYCMAWPVTFLKLQLFSTIYDETVPFIDSSALSQRYMEDSPFQGNFYFYFT
ncbi:hypothetical protein CRYUN_Cryun06bG0124800 [Craigia yunnanensis]